MRVIVAVVAFTACVVATFVGSILFASTVPDGACVGVVYDASICESLRLRQSLLAATLIGSALIAASVTSGALLSRRERCAADPPPLQSRRQTEGTHHGSF